jgi:hypothetical protein
MRAVQMAMLFRLLQESKASSQQGWMNKSLKAANQMMLGLILPQLEFEP